ERLAAGIALQKRHHLGRCAAFVGETPEPQYPVQAEGDFGLHVRELELYELVGREGLPELLPLHRVVTRGVPAEFGRAHRAPRYAEARLVEAAERAFEA